MPRRPIRSPVRRPAPPKLPGPPRPVEKVVNRVQDRANDLRERLQGVRGRVLGNPALERLLERASDSPVAAAPWFAEFRDCVEDEIDRDGGEALLEGLRGRRDQEMRRVANAVQFAQELSERFRDVRTRQRFLTEVAQPARRGEIDGGTAWQRTDEMTRMRVLDRVGTRAPNWTIGIAVTGSGGLGVGAGVGVGICGMRGRAPMVYAELSVGGGAVASVDIACQIQLARCEPPNFGGFSVAMGAGGGYNATGSIGAAFVPRLNKQGPLEGPLILWDFNSVSGQFGGGGGLDLSVMLGYGAMEPFRRKQPPPQ